MPKPTLYWHDYETFGIDPKRDRPSQFAGIRTDYDFNIIGEPLAVYCQLPNDYLPHPESCLLTGITPQVANSKGVIEAEFCQLIHKELSQPNTCALGYNSIRFDDEFTRNCFYRNFYDPYAREWQNGNSRWDIIDLVRAAKALRPDGINWPVDEEGKPVFKLELLTAANGLDHYAAHDALSDVHATIALAKLIKSAQPKLYDFFWRHRLKAEAAKLLQMGSFQPLVHVSGRYSNKAGCLAIVLPICRHPINTNGIIVYNLSIDPSPLLELSADEISMRLFTAASELPEGTERIPLKTVHLNKCPVLAPVSVLRPEDRARLGLDLPACYANIEKLSKETGLAAKIAAVFSAPHDQAGLETDPDVALYSGGFFSANDRNKIAKIPALSVDKLYTFATQFADLRLPELLFRYRARNYPESLSEAEAVKWRQHCKNSLSGRDKVLGFEEYFAIIQELKKINPDKQNILSELEVYATKTMTKLNIELAK